MIDLHTRFIVRVPDQTIYESPGRGTARPERKRIETTAGRLLFNEALPERLRFKNYAMTKDHLKLLVVECLQVCGPEVTVQVAEDVVNVRGLTPQTQLVRRARSTHSAFA